MCDGLRVCFLALGSMYDLHSETLEKAPCETHF